MVQDSIIAAKTKSRILLITPPMVQINTPYPATAMLAGFLQERGFRVAQADLSLGLALRLFSVDGLRQVEAAIRARRRRRTPATRHFLAHAETYIRTVGRVVTFLQGHDDTLAWRILAGGFLPEGPRFREALVIGHWSLGPRVPSGCRLTLLRKEKIQCSRSFGTVKHSNNRYCESLRKGSLPVRKRPPGHTAFAEEH